MKEPLISISKIEIEQQMTWLLTLFTSYCAWLLDLAFLVVLHFWILDVLTSDIVLINIDVIHKEVIAIALGIVVFNDNACAVALV